MYYCRICRITKKERKKEKKGHWLTLYRASQSVRPVFSDASCFAKYPPLSRGRLAGVSKALTAPPVLSTRIYYESITAPYNDVASSPMSLIRSLKSSSPTSPRQALRSICTQPAGGKRVSPRHCGGMRARRAAARGDSGQLARRSRRSAGASQEVAAARDGWRV
jgi:hypothetical protein